MTPVPTLPLEAFTAGLIHAVNNPLTYVQTNLSSLGRDLLELADLLEACEVVVDRAGPELRDEVARVRQLRDELAMDCPREVLARVIGDTRDGLAQVQIYLRAARAVPLMLAGTREPMTGGTWLTEVVAEHRATLPPSLSLEFVGGPPADFTGVPDHWRHIVGALLLNARDALRSADASGAAGRIRVTSLLGRVIVDDDGPGVSVNISDKIFLPFFTTRPGAVGLGLPLAVAMAEDGGGCVELVVGRSPLGGARFSVRLPVV